MKHVQSFSKWCTGLLLACSLAASTTTALASRGGETGGGGDAYTLDFIKTATQAVYPWLAQNGSKLSPPVDSSEFLLTINPSTVETLEQVFESCDGSKTGREVQACYNSKTGKTYLSRALYPVDSDAPSKIGLVAHEVFRKMGIEGNDYEITQQMSIAQESIIISASKTVITRQCYPTRNGAGLDNTSNLLKAIDIDPACEEAVSNYYKTSNRPITRRIVLQAYHDNPIVTIAQAADGTKCENPNWYIGSVTFHCTLSIQ